MNPTDILTNDKEIFSSESPMPLTNQSYRTKTLIVSFSLIILSALTLSSLILATITTTDLLMAGYWILSVVLLIQTRETSNTLFNISFFMTLYAGPIFIMTFIGEDFSQTLNSVILSPMLAYHLSNDKILFLLSIFEQLVCIKLFYINSYMEIEDSFEVIDILKKQLVSSIALNLVLLGAHVFFLELNSIQNNKKLISIEHEKRNSDKTNIFLYSCYHEFRNVLGQIINSIDLLDIKDTTSNKLNFTNAKFCCKLLINLSNTFLDIHKIERGVVEILPTSLVLHDFLSEIWNVCSSLINKKELRCSITISSKLPSTVTVDGYRISQILLNVISNSVKCTEAGSIDLEVDWISSSKVLDTCFEPVPYADDGIFEKNRTLSRFLAWPNRKDQSPLNTNSQGIMKFVISDTGCGMSEEKLARLFQKFEQLSDDTMARQAGAGLGLYISSSICTLMKGEIRAFSKPGKGTTFIFCIPCY